MPLERPKKFMLSSVECRRAVVQSTFPEMKHHAREQAMDNNVQVVEFKTVHYASPGQRDRGGSW